MEKTKADNSTDTLTSRELALRAVNHHQPPRIPWTLYLAKPIEEKLVEMWGPRSQWPCPQDDIIRILWPLECSYVTSKGFCDWFGSEYRYEHGGFMCVNPYLKEPDAKKIPQIDLVPESEIERILAIRKANPDCFIFYQFSMTFGERLWALRGLEQTLMDYLLESSFVHEALDILMEMHFKALDKVLTLPIDGVTIGDDYGAQRGLMISRKIFLEFFKPRLAQLYDKISKAGKVVMHHSCGDNTDIMADFIDIGLQVFHPLQAEAMNIGYIKREFGKDLTFRGGIGTQGSISSGSAAEARKEVRRAVEILSRGGGLFLETGKPIPEETPIENAVAVIEELCKVMHYGF